jgi:hypothetical protein
MLINITYVKSKTWSVSKLFHCKNNLTQAGLKKDTFGVSAQMCLQPAERDIQTPDKIAKYRKSYK